MVAPALGGGFEATLNTQNSLSVGDGFEFSASANGGNNTDAVNNACHGALGFLLFAKASQVWLRPAQWSVPEDDIIRVADMLKRMCVERWASQSAIIGDVTSNRHPYYSAEDGLRASTYRSSTIRHGGVRSSKISIWRSGPMELRGPSSCTVAVGVFSTSSCLLER